MSQASEWAAKWAPLITQARAAMPRIEFSSEQHDGRAYTVAAYVSQSAATGEPVLAFSSSNARLPIALRAPNALALAHFILTVFSEERSDEASKWVAPAGSGSRESRTTAGAAWGAPTGEESGAALDTPGA